MTTPSIFLLGGTSHAGKTTVARLAAAKSGFDLRSSDRLAKHPGRPWPNRHGVPVPAHVQEHYRSLDAEALLMDVLEHYRTNVVPQIRRLVGRYEAEPAERGVLIEGSALWPGFVSDLARRPSVRALWLVSDDQAIERRIRAMSDYAQANDDQKVLIDRFLARTKAYNNALVAELETAGLDWVSANSKTPEDLVDILFGPGNS